jgi:peptidoglycan/xylan/chitin deacetylase (PgdA/CDA1 family)
VRQPTRNGVPRHALLRPPLRQAFIRPAACLTAGLSRQEGGAAASRLHNWALPDAADGSGSALGSFSAWLLYVRIMALDRRTVLRSTLAALGGATVAGCTGQPEVAPPSNGVTTSPTMPSNPPSVEPSTTAPTGVPTRAAVEIGHGPRSVSRVALTFHGNGDPALARSLLDQVEQARVRISVFVVGTWLVGHPEMAQRILQGNHDLGNHTMHHKPMRRLAAPEAHREVSDCAGVLRRTAGSPGRWFRASGTQRTTPVIRAAATAAGYATCVSYDIDGLDWMDPDVTTVRNAVLNAVEPGSIVSLHLGHPVTIEALPAILSGLSARQLQPVTLTELLG